MHPDSATSLRLAASACAALWLLVSPAHASKPCSLPDDSPASATAQALLDTLVQHNGVPGMGAAVWRDGRIAWVGCTGWRDLETRTPVERDTRFRLASVSKVVTAAAAAQLAEEGRLDLDAPVAEALPWLAGNGWPDMSVRQLAAHTSGLPHYQPGDQAAGQRHHPTGRDAVRRFIERPLLSPPGQAYRYSSWGYTLIGAVIEAKTGRHLLTQLADRVTPGLDIGPDTDGEGAAVSRLYTLDGGVRRITERRDFSYTWGGGGLAGSPEAVANFGGRLMAGQLVSRATFEAMLQPARLADGQVVREPDRGAAIGLAWRVDSDADGARIAHHAGVTAGARSALVLWPDEQVAASVLSNAEWVSSIDQTAQLLAAPFRPLPAGLHATACPTRAVRFEGMLTDAAGARPVQGDARFTVQAGICRGELAPDANLKAQFKAARAWPGGQLALVGLDGQGGLARAALVTPYGLYDARADAAGTLHARLAGQSRLSLTWAQPSATDR